MASRAEVRKMALQALYQLDARPEPDEPAVREAVLDDAQNVGLTRDEAAEAYGLALAAFQNRRVADARIRELAPTWPAVRQPAVDRAVLRLAHYEITSGAVPPKIAVNEAVNLAKSFGGERSPGFVNGVLDKVLKDVAGRAAEAERAAVPAPDAPPNTEPDFSAGRESAGREDA